jgi:hypothetical protein
MPQKVRFVKGFYREFWQILKKNAIFCRKSPEIARFVENLQASMGLFPPRLFFAEFPKISKNFSLFSTNTSI